MGPAYVDAIIDPSGYQHADKLVSSTPGFRAEDKVLKNHAYLEREKEGTE